MQFKNQGYTAMGDANQRTRSRQFIGLAQHYRCFIPGFASIAAPLTDLTRGTGIKRRPIVWTAACTKSFQLIKDRLTSAPILQAPQMSKPFYIETDASDFGVGAVLLQPDNNNTWHPLAYESKKLSSAERNYPTQERELLAILHALRTWRYLVEGREYTVFTDHQPLIYFRSQIKPTPRLIRWMAEFELYNPKILYKPGKENSVPDLLSRRDGSFAPADTDSLEPQFLYTMPMSHNSDWPWFYSTDISQVSKELLTPGILRLIERHKQDFVAKDGQVYRKVRFSENDEREVLFLQFAERANAVQQLHESFGHMGLDSLLDILQKRFWWPSMRKDVKMWLKACLMCQINQRKDRTHHDEMHPLDVPSSFHRWHLDFIGELPTTLKGNRWILVAVDYATNWPIARPVPVASAEAVADFLYEEIVMRFGCPREILTDRGANFSSNIVKHYLKKLDVHHKLTSAFHPRTNGKCERLNGTLKAALRKYTNGALHRWDDFLNAALFACRIRKHATTGFSPFYLTYGREPLLPGDELQPYIDKLTMADQRTVDDITSREVEALRQNRAAAEFRMKAVANRDKIKWDAAIKKTTYELGDKVLLTHEGRFGLEPRFKGPYIVLKTNDETGTYLLEKLTGEPLKSWVHTDRLTAANGEAIVESWYDPTVSRKEWRDAMTTANRPLVMPSDSPSPTAPFTSPVADHVDPIATSAPLKDIPSIVSTDASPPKMQPLVNEPRDIERGLSSVQEGDNVDVISDDYPNQVIKEVDMSPDKVTEDRSQRQAKRTTTLGGVPKRSYAPTIVARKRRRLEAQN
jgi:hypothetical protein